MGYYFSYDTYFGDKKKGPREALEPSPELLDTFWGYYFATGRYRPVARIVAMLPWSQRRQQRRDAHARQHGEVHAREQCRRATCKLLAMLKRAAQTQPGKPVATALKEVINAAETVETSRLRKEAMASIEELRRKGPASRRNVTWWGQIGTGALSLGCIARRRHRACGARPALRDRRRDVVGGAVVLGAAAIIALPRVRCGCGETLWRCSGAA